MKYQRILLGLAIVTALVIIGLFGYQQFLAPPEATPTVVALETQVIPINAEGRVVPIRHASMAFEIPGKIARIHVAPGDQIVAGDPLIELENDALNAQVRQARAALAAASAQEDMLPGSATDEQKDLARAQVEQAQALLEASEIAFKRSELNASFTANVISVDAREGEVINAGMPLVILADTSQWEIDTLDVLEQDAVQLRRGQSALVEFAAYPDRQLFGWIDEIALNASSYQGNVTYTVTVRLPANLDIDLSWGMTAFVIMEAAPLIPTAVPTRTPTPEFVPNVGSTSTPAIKADPTQTPTNMPTATTTASLVPQATTTPRTIIHTVEEGQNLFRISLLYGVSIEAIQDANDLDNDLIYTGQRLIIPLGS
jgi:HlyD family secretion protein